MKKYVQLYDEANRRAERRSSRRRRRERRRRRCSVLQAALSVLLCPALSLLHSQALIRRTISTVQNNSRQCKREHTLWKLMIVKIPLTICKHKKAVGNEKKSKNKHNRQKHSWKQDTWLRLQQYQPSDWHEGPPGTLAFSCSACLDKQTWGWELHVNIKWRKKLSLSDGTESQRGDGAAASTAALLTSQHVHSPELHIRVWAGSYLWGQWLCWRGSWWRCLPRWAGGWDCWGLPCQWWPPAPARPPSPVCRWTCRTPWWGCWTQCWMGWFLDSGAVTWTNEGL